MTDSLLAPTRWPIMATPTAPFAPSPIADPALVVALLFKKKE
jgi:hypothetical protein